MRVNINVHPRLLSTVALSFSAQEADTLKFRPFNKDAREACFRCSDDELREMAGSFRENADAIDRWLARFASSLAEPDEQIVKMHAVFNEEYQSRF